MKKTLFLFTCLMLVFMACQSQTGTTEKNNASNEAKESQPPIATYSDISVAEFKTKMASGNVILMDVRTPAEIADGKIDGALELNFHDEHFVDELDKMAKEATYLVYCKSGGRSSSACEIMKNKGFKKLYNLDGGYTAWSKENQ